jgi:predicted transcriptional regulator
MPSRAGQAKHVRTLAPPFLVRLDPDQRSSLDRLARATGLPRAELVREAVSDLLNKIMNRQETR